jgi:hypothetical protein
MTKMFDYDGATPLEKLKYMDILLQYLTEQHELLAANQASDARLVEQLSSHLVDMAKAITSLYDNQKLLEIKLKELQK